MINILKEFRKYTDQGDDTLILEELSKPGELDVYNCKHLGINSLYLAMLWSLKRKHTK